MMGLDVIRSYSTSIIKTPIHVPFTISRESLPSADVVIIEITTNSGHVGLGECAPFPTLTYDDVTKAQKVASTLLSELVGMKIADAIEHLQNLTSAARQQSITAPVGVECALWDLRAQLQEASLASTCGAANLPGIESDITLPIMSPEAIASFWRLFAPYEFKTIKVKVAGQVDNDRAMLATLKQLVPPTTKFILDGNQGCNVDTALRLLDACDQLGIQVQFFEQPLPERAIDQLQQLCARTTVPICVDETVRSHQDLQGLLDHGLRPIVNIKIMKSGVAEAMQIIDLARRNSCPLMIGGMLESEIAMGFSLHIACGTGAFTYADLDTPFFFTRRLTKQSPWHSHTAWLELPAGLGLGMRLASAP